jgi:hypothetical protein
MTDAIEIALISDNNDQINSVAVWDIRNGTTLMQYRGKNKNFANFVSVANFMIFQAAVLLENTLWISSTATSS